LVKLDVLGTLVTLSEREAEELRDVAAADARSIDDEAGSLALARPRPALEDNRRS
jgi:hypothetical protein